MTSSAAVAAPPSSAALEVLSGLLRDAVLLAGRGTASPADVDTAMRLGAGHPAGPFEVLASLGPGRRSSLGLPGALPEAPTSGPTAAPADGGWTGPVGVLARSEGSGARLLGTLGKSLTRAVSRGRLDEATRAEVFGRVSLTHDAAALAGSDVVIEAVAEDLAVKAAVLGAVDAALPPSLPLPLATNTSSFRVGDLRPSVPSGRPVLPCTSSTPLRS